MGLIRVSDDAEKKIKEAADASGSTITTTVDKMLQSNDIASRLDKMGKWLGKRFEDLEAALECAVLDSKSNSNIRKTSRSKETYLEWEVVQDIMFDYLPEGAEEWLPGREDAARSSDNLDMGTFFSDGEIIYSEDSWGHTDWLRVSPRVNQYLKEKGVL